ncbi:divalent cation tolerance protein CutA [Actinophytocola sp.]|uniref:divalent cation tolerance protein CutA n=1 Tax=Actinophytocola sp. TaxID=1872138 RepID=UPI00389AF595
MYWWRDELRRRTEHWASLHTRRSLADAVVSRIEQEHPYASPVWLSFRSSVASVLPWTGSRRRPQHHAHRDPLRTFSTLFKAAAAGPLCLWPDRHCALGVRLAAVSEMVGTAVTSRSSGTTCHPIDLHEGYRTASRGPTQQQPSSRATRPLDTARSG